MIRRNAVFFAVGMLMLTSVGARLRAVSGSWSSDQVADESGFLKSEPVTYLQFDPEALVILGPGADGLPGRAGVDDQLNGQVDEVSEMGAVGSDDVCLAPWQTGYAELKEQPGAVAISKGSYLPTDSQNAASRVVVRGTSDGKVVVRNILTK